MQLLKLMPRSSIERHIVVGAAGFIGKAMVRKLLQEGCAVVAVVQPARAVALADIGAEIVHSDARTVDWAALLRPGDIVHYYAWNSVPGSANADPAHDMNTNISPLIRLLEAARRIAKPLTVLFSSSGGTVYGKLNEVPVPENHTLAPLNAYGATKAAAELYLNFYRQLYSMDCRIARLANPYGHGQSLDKGQGAASIFMDQVARRKPLHVWGDGEIIRDYLHVDDAVCGLLAIARAEFGTTSSTFNLGSGHGLSLNGLIAHMQSFVDWKIEVQYEAPRGFDIPTSVLDISRAQMELGWEPAVDMRSALRAMFDAAYRPCNPLNRGSI